MSSFKKLLDSAKNKPVEEVVTNESPKNETSTKKSKQTSTKDSVQAPEKVSLKKITEVGKSKNPNYRQTSIYVRKDVHRKLVRLLEDQEYPGDFSDWIEECMLSEIVKYQNLE